MTTEELYRSLDKLREQFLAKQPKHNNSPLLSSESVLAYLDEVKTFIAGRPLDPDRPAVVLRACIFNFAEWPPGEYPGLELRDSHFLNDSGQKIDRNFSDVRVLGPFTINVAISGAGDLMMRNVNVEGTFRLEVNIDHGDMALERVTCGGPATIVGSRITRVKDCVFNEDVRWHANSWRKTGTASAIEMHGVQYEADCAFESGAFDSAFDFKGTKFSCRAIFDGLSFKKGVHFQEVQFGDASFRGTTFAGRALFTGAKFKGADFSNAQFLDTTEFSMARFEKAPLFHGAKMHPDTVFDKAKFVGHRHSSDWAAYRTLREMMAKLGAGAEESEFFVHEQRAQMLREMARPVAWPSVLSSFLYWAFSRYGQSIARPLMWLTALNYGFVVLYGFLGGISVTADHSGSWACSMAPELGLMWQNLINPFGFFGKVTPYRVDSLAVAEWSVVQSLLSALMLTLLALAIRRRFRKAAE